MINLSNVAGMIDILNMLTGVRDQDTGKHVYRVAGYTELMLHQMNKLNNNGVLFTDDQIMLAKMAARLHDVGKVGITDLILNKNDRLLEMEFERMKEHTSIGHAILRKGMENPDNPKSLSDLLRQASEVALYHHERWDGKGYPKGVKGKSIPLLARVISVVDLYDALTSKRAYKHPMEHEDTKQILIESSGKQLDPALVKVFISIEKEFKALNAKFNSESEDVG